MLNPIFIKTNFTLNKLQLTTEKLELETYS